MPCNRLPEKEQKNQRQTLPWTSNKNNGPDTLSYSQNFKHTMLSPRFCKYMGGHVFTALGTSSLTRAVQSASTGSALAKSLLEMKAAPDLQVCSGRAKRRDTDLFGSSSLCSM